MKKNSSYRQKLLELAKIYKISKILDNKDQLNTQNIELLLLKNKVPIPSGKTTFTIFISNTFTKPFFSLLGQIKFFFIFLFKKIIFAFRKIKNFFVSIGTGLRNFFVYLSKSTINFLNNIHNTQYKANSFNKFISRLGLVSFFALIAFGVYYLKETVSNFDFVKISLEIKSDKSKSLSEKNTTLEIIKEQKVKQEKKVEPKKTPKAVQKEDKKPKKEQIAKLPSEKKSNDTKKSIIRDKTFFDLNTETVLSLFEDLEYDLDQVRSDKKIKPIYFTQFPKDLGSISSVREKKETFIKIVLPLIVTENQKIEEDRKILKRILKKNKINETENTWLTKKFKEYKVTSKKKPELLSRMDVIPVSIALAQAAKESGWGTSRFALEGNALFGQWTWNGTGIEPLKRDKEETHKILKFPILRASVKAYIKNLNTQKAYKKFREKRSNLRNKKKNLSGLDLIHSLDKYAETGKEYTKILEKIIIQNSLSDFENVFLVNKKDSDGLNL